MARRSSFREEYCDKAKALCQNGATDLEVAETIGINAATLYRWKGQFPQFSEALKAGKEVADDRVERSLYNRAVGYTYESEKVFQFQGVIVRAPINEHVPPDTTAAIFWLKNRKPAEWRDRSAVEHSGPDGGPIEIGDKDRARALAAFVARTRVTKP